MRHIGHGIIFPFLPEQRENREMNQWAMMGCRRRDIAHMQSIGLKELRETKAWLRFIRKADLVSGHRLHSITKEADHLSVILSKSSHTAKNAERRRS